MLHQGGPLLVLAGAGSGKTRTLTYRMAHLILHRRVPARHILAITFTNKAAEEMRLRVQRLLGTEKTGIWMGTFHATCARILRQHIDRLGYGRHFVIYDDADQLRVIKACLKKLPSEGKPVRAVAVQAMLDKAKNQGIDPVLLVPQTSPLRETLVSVLEAYRHRLQEADALDFGDLILLVLRLFDEFPEVRNGYQERFHSILVDEYQDTNRAQHLLLQKLAPDGGDLCVVGDDDQSIYRWRGAEVNNLLDFEKDFPGARVLVLEENYRSTQTILRAADAVARGNPHRKEKRLWTLNEVGERIAYDESPTPDEEARCVAREIQRLVTEQQLPYRDIGVFFRTNAQSRPFEETFVLFRIPHAVIGSVRFYERAEVKDLVAYLRFLYNPNDSVSFLRILNQPPRGIGASTQAALQVLADEQGKCPWEAMGQALKQGTFSGISAGRIGRFQDVIRKLQRALESDAWPGRLLKTVVEQTGYRAFLEGKEDGERRMENVEEFVRTADSFQPTEPGASAREALGEFLQRTALVSDMDQYEDRANCVSLMTLHCAKGLEFSIVLRDFTASASDELGISSTDNKIFVPAKTVNMRFRNRALIRADEVEALAASGGNNENSNTENINQLDKIIVQVAETEYLSSTAEVIRRMLLRRHNDLYDFEVTIPELLLKQQQRTKNIFNIVLGVIAGISLLVGGIGIMNIMLASVLERIREIGVRQAIGASRIDIIVQFLSESTIISVSGGIIGIILGVALSKIITVVFDIQTIISAFSIIISFGVSVIVGITFGYLPAKRASQHDPVNSLRY